MPVSAYVIRCLPADSSAVLAQLKTVPSSSLERASISSEALPQTDEV